MKILSAFLLLLLTTCYTFAQTSGNLTVTSEKPIVLGSSQMVTSKELGESRTINIYLPEGYNPNDTVKYPVVYLLDGGVEEDFIHIVGLIQYNMQPWINRFPKSIVVGIENTNRRRDFTFAVPDLDFVKRMGFKKEQFPQYGGSGKFIAFLENELQPYIDKEYATNNRKTIIGESLAGLMATEILLKHTSLFDTYIIMSPSLWWGKESLLTQAPTLLQQNKASNIQVYIGNCNKDEDKIMNEDAIALSEILKNYSNKNWKVYYDYLPKEVHATIIHQAVYNAFQILYPRSEYQR